MKRVWNWILNRDLQELDLTDPRRKQSVWMIRIMRRTNVFSILLFVVAILIKLLVEWLK
jgi:hypothetical protein